MNYYNKYMMYKQKYAELKTMLGGASTRGNSYQPALKNMLGGAGVIFNGNNKEYTLNKTGRYRFMTDVILEFFKWKEINVPHNNPDIVEYYNIKLYDKRHTNSDHYSPDIESNNPSDFFSDPHTPRHTT